MAVQFSVAGLPKGKGRPKFARTGQHVRTYTPHETAVYENLVKLEYMRQVGNKKLSGALRAVIQCCFPVPKSVSRKRRAAMLSGEIRHTGKPDCDNLAKGILDALNGIAYDDDSQICVLAIAKKYAEQAEVLVILEGISC